MKNKLLYLILILIIIFGAIVYAIKGFNKELNYSNRQEFEISSASTLDEIKIEEIAKSVITDRGVKVQKLERFNNALEIISTSISEEEKENIINKINEECNESISNDDTKIISITSTRIITIRASEIAEPTFLSLWKIFSITSPIILSPVPPKY